MNLLNDYRKFEKLVNKYDGSGILNISTTYFLAPTTLIPLLCFINGNEINKIITNPCTNDYVYRILNGMKICATIPYTILPTSEKTRQNDDIASKMALNFGHEEYTGSQTIFHVYNELINNVYNHTPFEEGYANHGYIYAQKYPSKRKLDVCVMDDGLSIPGKFEMYGFEFEDDCDAIFQAINQTSTAKEDVDSPKYKRGSGLYTTLRLVIEGNGGSALIVSRNGCLYIKSKDNFKYYSLDNNNIFKGTLVSLRFNKNPVQNYYSFIEIDDGIQYRY